MIQHAATQPGSDRPLRLSTVALGTFALRSANLGLTFLIGVLLARLLGADGYGAFVYAISWVTLLVIPAQLGFNKLLVREVAAYGAAEKWGEMRGLLRLSDALVMALCVVIAGASAALSYLIRWEDPQMAACFRIGMGLLPIMAWVHLKRSAMEGLHRVRLAQVPETLVQPLLLLLLVLGLQAWLGESFSAPRAVAAAVVSFSVAAMVAAALMWHAAPPMLARHAPNYRARSWVTTAIPMALFGAMTLVMSRTDIIMLGIFRGAGEAGIYAVSARLAELIIFAMVILEAVIGPTIARLHARGDTRQLQAIVTAAARAGFVAAAVVVGIYLFAGGEVLGLFGEAFRGGYPALLILGAGQLLNALAGCVGVTQLMMGRERFIAAVFGSAAALNVALNLLLIPTLGMHGAAAATAVSTVFWNAILVADLYRRTGINATVARWRGRARQP